MRYCLGRIVVSRHLELGRTTKSGCAGAAADSSVFAFVRTRCSYCMLACFFHYAVPADPRSHLSSSGGCGVLSKGDSRRFGFHNLRHSLASFLVRGKTDPKTVPALLRHSDVKTTLQLYAHSVSDDRLAAQGQVLDAILQSGSAAVSTVQ